MTPSREPRSLAEIVREQTNDGLLQRCMTLARSGDAAPHGTVGARFSRVLRNETRGGSRINRFLADVATRKLSGATPDDVRNARKLLES